MKQQVYTDVNVYDSLVELIEKNEIDNLLLVCDKAFEFLSIKDTINKLNNHCKIHYFDNFTPNPLYESICEGVELYRNNDCTAIMAIGGGSAIDVAKCIKLYAEMNSTVNYLKQEIVENNIPLIAIPTTAGTGSEATRYAVIYYNGDKQSVTHDSCIPQYVYLLPELLYTLPMYQKKATMLDALCHSIESYWSVNSTEESMKFSREALRLILENIDGYLNNTENGNKNMLIAANLAGKAINITQTTAGHAMCYKITSLFGISHGHAAACCLIAIWDHMINNLDKVCDERGKNHVEGVFNSLAECFNCQLPAQAVTTLKQMLTKLELIPDISLNQEQLEILVNSVNETRLKNNPVALNKEDIRDIYIKVFEK